MRDQMKVRLGNESVTQINELYLSNQFEALDRICNNVHSEKYKRRLTSTATGASREQVHMILSDSTLKYLEEESKKGVLGKIKNSLSLLKNDDTTP